MRLADLFETTHRDITELFMGKPVAANWEKKTSMGVNTWTTGFDFQSPTGNVRVGIELIDDYGQIMAKYMFRAAGKEINPNARGFGVNFDVEGNMDTTGNLGPAAARLIGEVLARCMHFWNENSEFSYVVFTGAEGSRNRLYGAMARRLAAMAGAKLITHRDDFLIYLPETEGTNTERVDERLARVKGRWALVSKKTGKPLQYYRGSGRPSKEWVQKVERRVQYFKHGGG